MADLTAEQHEEMNAIADTVRWFCHDGPAS